jgi:hypothetical protein
MSRTYCTLYRRREAGRFVVRIVIVSPGIMELFASFFTLHVSARIVTLK